MKAPNGTAIKRVREKLGMSQSRFAEAFRLNFRTLQGWEGGRTTPEGATVAYVWLIVHYPNAILKLLQESK